MRDFPIHLKSLFDEKLVHFGIGDLAKGTGITPSKLRYWESKGYIHPVQITEGQNRKYSLGTFARVHAIKNFLDEGYTLPVAVKKTNEQKETMQILRKVMETRFEKIEEYGDQPAVNMGTVEACPGKKLLAIVGLDDVKLELVDED